MERLVGRKILEIKATPEDAFVACLLDNGETFKMWHDWDCCESVWLEDGWEDLLTIIGEEIKHAEVVYNADEGMLDDTDESFTWTFYKLRTHWKDVTLRFYGCSNGYYGEEVNWDLKPESYWGSLGRVARHIAENPSSFWVGV